MFESKRDEYLGLKGKNNQGYEMEVIEYDSYKNIKIRFLPPYEGVLHSSMYHFLSGDIHNPFAPTVRNFGIVGTKYPISYKQNGKRVHNVEYFTWTNMLKRSFDQKEKEKCPSYKDVTCDLQWQYFENFYDWIHSQENFETLKKQNNINLDKDILVKGNKTYGPNTCTLVPRNINNLLVRLTNNTRQYPIGVYYIKRSNKYMAESTDDSNMVYLGCYETPEEAFLVYKNYKENRIKKIAKDEFKKGNITEKCYNALINYEIEITD